jgi:hypothetical protein
MNLLGSKRLALLLGCVPKAALFGILVNPNNPMQSLTLAVGGKRGSKCASHLQGY